MPIGSPVSIVIDMMQEGGRGCVLVVDEDEQLAGIITERDLLQHCERTARRAYRI